MCHKWNVKLAKRGQTRAKIYTNWGDANNGYTPTYQRMEMVWF